MRRRAAVPCRTDHGRACKRAHVAWQVQHSLRTCTRPRGCQPGTRTCLSLRLGAARRRCRPTLCSTSTPSRTTRSAACRRTSRSALASWVRCLLALRPHAWCHRAGGVWHARTARRPACHGAAPAHLQASKAWDALHAAVIPQQRDVSKFPPQTRRGPAFLQLPSGSSTGPPWSLQALSRT